jgi:5-methylcytosine-specific restriction endonuclease McrA
MKAYEIAGGYAHICDCCGKDDGRPTLYWEKENFDLCYECLEKLYFGYIKKDISKTNEDVKVIRKYITEELRDEIFARDFYRCKICGSDKDLTVDHIIPFSKGGSTKKDNLQTLCRNCNRKKGANIN